MKMQLCNVWIVLNDVGSNAPRSEVTPAEMVILRSQFGVKVQGQSTPTNPLSHIDVVGEVDRSSQAEYMRLCGRYGEKTVEKDFTKNQTLPGTLEEIGMEPTKDKEPERGKEHAQYLPLEKLAKEETQDEESVKEAAARVAQAKQVSDLAALVAAQSAQIDKLLSILVAQKTNATSTTPNTSDASQAPPATVTTSETTSHSSDED